MWLEPRKTLTCSFHFHGKETWNEFDQHEKKTLTAFFFFTSTSFPLAYQTHKKTLWVFVQMSAKSFLCSGISRQVQEAAVAEKQLQRLPFDGGKRKMCYVRRADKKRSWMSADCLGFWKVKASNDRGFSLLVSLHPNRLSTSTNLTCCCRTKANVVSRSECLPRKIHCCPSLFFFEWENAARLLKLQWE